MKMETIDNYLKLFEQRPALFNQDEHVKLILDRAILEEYAKVFQLGLIYESKYFWVINDLVEEGSRRFPYTRMIHKANSNGVVIIPKMGKDIVFLRQFRHGTRQIEIELPRGFAEENQTKEDNAAQEIFEEIGTQARHLQYLGEMISDSALTNGPVHIFLCEIETIGELQAEEGIQATQLLTLDEAIQWIQQNRIRDGFSICALMKLLAHQKEDEHVY